MPSLLLFEVVYSSGSLWVEDTSHAIPTGSAEPMADLPPEVERDRHEAWARFHAWNYRAAIIMARAAVQRAVRQLNAEGAGLKREIQDLVAKGVITQDLSDFAHEVRIAGDDAAHPEELGQVTRQEAEESLQFLDSFLDVAIAMPERSKRRKEGRKAASSQDV